MEIVTAPELKPLLLLWKHLSFVRFLCFDLDCDMINGELCSDYVISLREY